MPGKALPPRIIDLANFPFIPLFIIEIYLKLQEEEKRTNERLDKERRLREKEEEESRRMEEVSKSWGGMVMVMILF